MPIDGKNLTTYSKFHDRGNIRSKKVKLESRNNVLPSLTAGGPGSVMSKTEMTLPKIEMTQSDFKQIKKEDTLESSADINVTPWDSHKKNVFLGKFFNIDGVDYQEKPIGETFKEVSRHYEMKRVKKQNQIKRFFTTMKKFEDKYLRKESPEGLEKSPKAANG